jgi:hypothetical protein
VVFLKRYTGLQSDLSGGAAAQSAGLSFVTVAKTIQALLRSGFVDQVKLQYCYMTIKQFMSMDNVIKHG